MKKEHILYVFKLPPPINGATTANFYLWKSKILREKFNGYYLNYGLSRTNHDFGTIRFGKIKHYFYSFAKCLFWLTTKEIDLCYITIAPRNIGFVKDSLFILLFKIFKKKYVIHLHGKGINEKVRYSKLWRLYYEFVFKKSHVICLSERLIKDISRIYHQNPFLVPNGIETYNYQHNKNNKDKLIILFLSNLYIQKGVIDFIKAIKILSKNTKVKFEALVVGNSTRDITFIELREMVKKNEMEKWIKILGPKYGSEKIEILGNSDLFVFPTYNETFGLVNLEAMAAGIPIISTNEGGIPDVVEDGINGYLVEKNEPEKLADKMKILLEDENLRQTMGETNKKKFKMNYSKDHFEKNISKVFTSILNQKQNDYASTHATAQIR